MSWAEKNLLEKTGRNIRFHMASTSKFILLDESPLWPDFSKGLAAFSPGQSCSHHGLASKHFLAHNCLHNWPSTLPETHLNTPSTLTLHSTPTVLSWSHPTAYPSCPQRSLVVSSPRACTYTALHLEVHFPFPTRFSTWPALHI